VLLSALICLVPVINVELDSAKHCVLLSCSYWSSSSGLVPPVCSCDCSAANALTSNGSKSSVPFILLSSPSDFIIYNETSIKHEIDEPVMDDLSPLRPILVMLLFWFIMGVIRLDSDCMELLLTEGILPRGESCNRPCLEIFLKSSLDCASKCGKQCRREPGQWLCYQEYCSMYLHLQGGLFLCNRSQRCQLHSFGSSWRQIYPKILRLVHASKI
jgi:hypothetical protein